METPYYIIPAVEALPTATGEERVALIRLIAANIGDEATLRSILGIDPAEFSNFYPDLKPPQLSTDETISTFMDRFAPTSRERSAENPADELPIAAPAADYATILASEGDYDEPTENSSPDATSDAISAFLAAVPPKTPKSSARKSRETDSEQRGVKHNAPDPQLSEALFKMMVKNKNYTKALEIIKELSLNNPKKSIYFAHQIRFLEKLIKIQAN